MTKAETNHTPSRRLFLGGFAGATGAAALPLVTLQSAQTTGPSLSPDVELIAACLQFEALECQYLSLFVGSARIEDDDEREMVNGPIYVEQDKMVDDILELPPTTLAGCQALARAAIIWAPDEIEWGKDFNGLHDYLTVALLRALAGEEWVEQVFLTRLGRPERAVPEAMQQEVQAMAVGQAVLVATEELR